MRRRSHLLAVGLVLLAAGCATRPPVFTDGPVVTAVDDTRDMPRPVESEFWRLSHHIENFVVDQARLRLDPVPAGPARDVNRLGEVPDSSWYANRLHRLTPAEVGQGQGGDDPGPEAFLPWEITGVKSGGRNPGFVFRDARGARYICKFDKRGTPIIATGAGSVAGRLLWACGYHVPDDRVVYFERSDLGIDPEATIEEAESAERPLTDADIDALLASLPSLRPDGRYRALVSRYLPGRPVGGYAYAGTRDDDPNDVIPHQDRRSLRGLRVFCAWLGHVDLKVDNTLDVHVEQDGRRFLRHYLVDFDGCLGGYWAARHEARIGFAYEVDLKEFFAGIPVCGLYRRPYEVFTDPDRTDLPEHPEIGLFEAEVYDPAGWQPNYLNEHLSTCRPADAFWAGTILARVTDEAIAAAVAAGRYEDPAADEVLTRVLIERRDRTVDWALGSVAPVTIDGDPMPVDGGLRIPARNAFTVAGRPAQHDFEAEVLDRAGRRLVHSGDLGVTPAFTVPASSLAGDSYLVVRWLARDGRGDRLPPTEAHYRRSGDDWRLMGVLRDGQ